MSSELYWLREWSIGRLAVMPRPRGGRLLAQGVELWREQGVTSVVSLLEQHEIDELELRDEPSVCASNGIDFKSFPIPDGGVPRSMRHTKVLVAALADTLVCDGSLAIHCRAGIGRAPLIAGCVLLRFGLPLGKALSMLRSARGFPVPETSTQLDWLTEFKRSAGANL